MRQNSSSGPVDEEFEHRIEKESLSHGLSAGRSLARDARSQSVQTSVRPRYHVETSSSDVYQSDHSQRYDSETERVDSGLRDPFLESSVSECRELAEVHSHCDPLRRRREARIVVYNPAFTIDHMLCADKLLIRRSWRSLPGHWAILPLLSFFAIELSNEFPESIFETSIPMWSFDLLISLPLFILPLALLVCHAFWMVYNRHLILDSQYLIYYRGNFSAMREVAEMEVGRMQVVTVKQSPWEALLGVGNVSLGTFTRRSVEFDLYGVANPHRLARIFKLAVRRARELEKDESTADEELAHLEQAAENS